MTVTGTYNNSSGALTIPVSGTTTPGTDFGQLSVTGAATLGGTLALQTASGFTPPYGTHYTILKAASISGTFATVTGRVLTNGQYILTYHATSVVETFEPLTATVTSVSPRAGPIAGGSTVTITGTHFVNNPTVAFGGTAATDVTVVSPTKLTATTPAEAAGTVDVTVNNGSGSSATSSADHYTYDAVPTVTAVSPTAGPTAGGDTVTITGTNFASGATARFGTLSWRP